MCVASFDYLGDPAHTSSGAYSIGQCSTEEQAQLLPTNWVMRPAASNAES